MSGVVRLWAGQPDIAIEHAKAALRLCPRASLGASLNVIGAGLLYGRRFEEAISVSLRMIRQDPTYTQAYGGLAACYALLGRIGREAGPSPHARHCLPAAPG
jgi:predicted Zn-dependent protease